MTPGIEPPPILVVMGVSGAGKTTVAKQLAARLGWPFEEGDDLHPAANIEKMRGGNALTDEDREPWLRAVAAWIDRQCALNQPGIITCSALKKRYRELLTGGRPGVRLVYLRGTPALIARRLAGRHGHFMPAALIQSQFDTLEEPDSAEDTITVDAALPPGQIAQDIIDRLKPQVAKGGPPTATAEPEPD